MGWTSIEQLQPHPLFKGIRSEVDFYFVHSYKFIADDLENILSRTDYGEDFASIVGKENVIGVQFHPEKSQINGLRLLENFCLWDGKC
jgi:glutamine amidotransferase